MSTSSVLEEVYAERRAQEEKWGEQNHPWSTFGVWGDYTTAEEAKRGVDGLAAEGFLDYAGILTEEYLEAIEEVDVYAARVELVQVAAVAVAAIESIDRNGR